MSAFVLKCAGLGHAHLSPAQDLQQTRRPLPVQATPQALLQPWQWGATVSSGRPLVDQLLAYQITREAIFSESHSIQCPARVTAFMSQARAFSPASLMQALVSAAHQNYQQYVCQLCLAAQGATCTGKTGIHKDAAV